MERVLIDLDVFGRSNSHEKSQAISNAMLLYIGSSRGDYLYAPGLAGEVSRRLFKLNQAGVADSVAQDMEEVLRDIFSGYVGEVEVDTRFEGNEQLFSILWRDVEGVESNLIELREKMEAGPEKEKGLVKVPYTGTNLLGFVLLQEVDEVAEYGVFDGTWGWRWGKFLLENLRETDPNYDDIMAVIQ